MNTTLAEIANVLTMVVLALLIIAALPVVYRGFFQWWSRKRKHS